MAHFYVCEPLGSRETPCVFTENSMRNIWKRSGGDIGRCVRHGALICIEVDAKDKKEVHERFKRD